METKMLGIISRIEKLKWQLEFLDKVHPEAVKAALDTVEKSTINDVFSADPATLVEFLGNVCGELPYRTDSVTHTVAEEIRTLSNMINEEVTSAGGFRKVSQAWFKDEGTMRVQLFDVVEAQKVAISIAGSGAIAERLAQTGPWRQIGFDPGILDRLQDLKGKTPNFEEVIDSVMDAVSLAIRYKRPVALTPILVVGEAGIGKTFFTDQLSQCLNLSGKV